MVWGTAPDVQPAAELAHPNKHTLHSFRERWSMLRLHCRQVPVHKCDAQLSHAKLAECRENLPVQPVAVHPLGRRTQTCLSDLRPPSIGEFANAALASQESTRRSRACSLAAASARASRAAASERPTPRTARVTPS